jgi:hypothetical protein
LFPDVERVVRDALRIVCLFASTFTLAIAADSTRARVTAAGNAADETVRLAQLRELADRSDAMLDAATRRELAELIPVVAAWAEGRTKAAGQIARQEGEAHRYLHDFFNHATRPFNPPFPAPHLPFVPFPFFVAQFRKWIHQSAFPAY